MAGFLTNLRIWGDFFCRSLLRLCFCCTYAWSHIEQYTTG
jgi:hypothetical protein